MNVYTKVQQFLLFASLSTLALLTLSCSDDSKHKRPSRGHLVSVANVVSSSMQSTLVLSGSLEAYRSVNIYNQVDGLILDIMAYQSDKVENEQVIVTLDSQLIRAELKKAHITQQQAALDFKRAKQLKQKRIASDEVLARAKTALDLATASKAVLQTQFEYTQIKAPFSGVISKRLKEPGDVVAKYSHLLTLVDTSKLKATISLSELLLPNIQVGNKVTLQIDAVGNETYTAIISRVYPTIDTETRQGTFEILLDTPPALAKPGQLSRITIKGLTSPRLHVPLAAIKYNATGSYVYKVVDNKTALTKITTGIQVGNNIEITSNLSEGDLVVTKGFIGLGNSKKVTIATTNTATDKN